MSIAAMNWAYQQRTGSPVRKAVLVALADFADDKHVSWPSVLRLAAMCEVSESTVRRALRELEAAGLIQVDRTRMRDSGGQTSNLYQLAVAGRQLTLLDGAARPRTPADEDGRGRPVNLTPPGCQQRQGGGVSSDSPYEPPLEPSGEQTHSSGKPDEPPGFASFWKAYPNSNRKVGKAKCLERWKVLKLEPSAGVIVAHVEAMKKTRDWREHFEPAPLRYLRERRWQDEVHQDPPERKPIVSLSDYELERLAGELQVSTRGLSRAQLIDKIHAKQEARP